MGGGGSIKFFRRKIFVSQCRKTSLGNPLVCHLFRVSKNFMFQRLFHDFPSKSFCLKVPKKIVGELFCAAFQKCSGSEKVYG